MMHHMSKISRCEVTRCAYNQDHMCHALAITVGGGTDHMCDTFFEAEAKGGDPEASGGVGACRSTSCMYNEGYECQAAQIVVGREEHPADCLTFEET